MPLWPNFVGPAYRTRSAGMATDACENLYLETTRNAADPKKATLYGTPAQVLYDPDLSGGSILPEAGCRGLFSQDGRIFGVNGSSFYEYRLGPPATLGNAQIVANDGRLVTFASNGLGGNQLAICSAGALYILDITPGGPPTGVWTVVSLPFVPVMVGFMDGYFLANEKNTPKMWFSNLFDGTTWSALDFFTRSSTSDNVTGFIVNNRRIWVFGTKTTEIFQDSGDPTTPFIPYPGTVINEGTYAYASITSIADTVFWVGSTKEFGATQIFAASGLQPRAISTPPISEAIAPSTDITEAEALVYTQGGHVFVCWTWPSITEPRPSTWCYDLTEDAWHARINYVEDAPGSEHYIHYPWQARGCCAVVKPSAAQPTVLVGQVDTKFLCELRLDQNADQTSHAGVTNPILRQRVAPYFSAENQWIFLHQIELGVDGLLADPPVTPVELILTEYQPYQAVVRPVRAAAHLRVGGQAVVQWFQLGRYRADHLVLIIRQSVDAPCVWGPGLWVRATAGTGQL